MNNWRRYVERVDIWVARFSTEAAQRYWGFSNLQKNDANRVVKMLQVCHLGNVGLLQLPACHSF